MWEVYFDIIRETLNRSIEAYMLRNNQSRSEVLVEIKKQIDSTQVQHFKDDPEIDYRNPLCRLGYLYRHAGVNATFFERILIGDEKLQSAVTRAIGRGDLNICSLGGGPGTEMLGIGKYLLNRGTEVPSKIVFTVLDNVHPWAETWKELANSVERKLHGELGTSKPIVASSFLPFDVLDATSYSDYTSMFKSVDILICNYLFSENKPNLDKAGQAVERLVHMTNPDCVFAVIDRLESRTSFKNDVVNLFQSAFKSTIEDDTLIGVMDGDEQKDVLGQDLLEVLGSPRVDFQRRTNGPTVFWFTVMRDHQVGP